MVEHKKDISYLGSHKHQPRRESNDTTKTLVNGVIGLALVGALVGGLKH